MFWYGGPSRLQVFAAGCMGVATSYYVWVPAYRQRALEEREAREAAERSRNDNNNSQQQGEKISS